MINFRCALWETASTGSFFIWLGSGKKSESFLALGYFYWEVILIF